MKLEITLCFQIVNIFILLNETFSRGAMIVLTNRLDYLPGWMAKVKPKIVRRSVTKNIPSWLVADSPDCVAPPRNSGAMPRRRALSKEPSPTP
jgi:hypothetical protein